MSGIVGIVNLDGMPVDRDLLSRMTNFMAYRGPDAQEIWIEGNVGFGHTMLKTTFEAETEKQPLTLDGEIWLTADARIDARGELISALKERLGKNLNVLGGRGGQGDNSRDPNDAELILHAYQAWGEDCVRHLIGDFAFAIWDRRQRKLFCARDHLGLKPFFYAHIGNTFVFSNTLNCVQQHPRVSDELNDLAMADFLVFAYNQDFKSTSFADIQRLAPASCLILDREPRCSQYWGLSFDHETKYRNSRDYSSHFLSLLQESVSDRMRAPRVAISMSGGLDSTTVAAFANALSQENQGLTELQAFTMVYDHLIPDEEKYHAGLVAEHLRLPIHYLPVDDYELYDRWNNPELKHPEPLYYPLSTLSLDFTSNLGGYSRVLLTGDGGDLALLPSADFLANQIKSLQPWPIIKCVAKHLGAYGRIPALGFRTTFRKWRGQNFNMSQSLPDWLDPGLVRRYDLASRLEQLNAKLVPTHPRRPEAYEGIAKHSWTNVFEQDDPGFTGVPVERRHPFFDLRLIQYLFSIPDLALFVDKDLTRTAAKRLLPESIRLRPKTPLRGSPLQKLWQDNWRGHFDPVPQLEAYVDIDVFLKSSPGEEIDYRWQNYLPVSLNYWLRKWNGQGHNSRNAKTREEKETAYEFTGSK